MKLQIRTIINERKSLLAGLKWSCLHVHSTTWLLIPLLQAHTSVKGVRGYTGEQGHLGHTISNGVGVCGREEVGLTKDKGVGEGVISPVCEATQNSESL